MEKIFATPKRPRAKNEPVVFEAVLKNETVEAPIEEEESNFPKGTAEHYMSIHTTVNKAMLKLMHPLFSMRIDGDNLMFDLNGTLSRRLCNEEITCELEASITCFDFLLSPNWSGSFEWAQGRASRLVKEMYEEGDEDHQIDLMSYYALMFFKSKFDDISKLSDIDREIPIQLFVNILNKNKDMEISYTDNEGNIYAGLLNRAQIVKNMFSANIYIEMFVISAAPRGYAEGVHCIYLPYKDSACNITDIGLSLVTEESKATFIERGKKYLEYTSKPKYCNYKGFAYKPGAWNDVRTFINGRVMIDLLAMRTLNSKVGDHWYEGNPFHSNSAPSVDEDKVWMCMPIVYGFSFYTKEWIRMSVENMSEIEFSDSAFDELIVPQEYKDIFVASLTNDMPSLDSISGKGSGKIFLLYGPPGCGKTLTGESVSELLHKPLYFVTVGELGTTPEQMENNLSKVMQVATSWDSVVLLDEVDVFAADRTNADIERTAMTAILLRLLERYEGIMFMTTNLLDNLDPAFISRATATIPYEALKPENRYAIWSSLLSKAEKLGITIGEDVQSNIRKLSYHNVNGREIKNYIRLAYALAMNKDKIITLDILERVIGLRKLK